MVAVCGSCSLRLFGSESRRHPVLLERFRRYRVGCEHELDCRSLDAVRPSSVESVKLTLRLSDHGKKVYICAFVDYPNLAVVRSRSKIRPCR